MFPTGKFIYTTDFETISKIKGKKIKNHTQISIIAVTKMFLPPNNVMVEVKSLKPVPHNDPAYKLTNNIAFYMHILTITHVIVSEHGYL